MLARLIRSFKDNFCKERPMRTRSILLALTAAMALAGSVHPAAAQIGLPNLGNTGLGNTGVNLPVDLPVDLPLPALQERLEGLSGSVQRTARRLLRVRTERIDDLIRQHRDLIERDARGEPARRGELLMIAPTPAALAAVRQAGFAVTAAEEFGSLGLSIVRLTVPRGMSLSEAQEQLARIAPDAEISADNLHFQSGSTSPTTLPLLANAAANAPVAASITAPVGVIDGGVESTPPVTSQRGFASGAPLASHHGSAMVSLLAGAGTRDLRLADIYGSDPAGGGALALIRALDWLAGGGARVISISLSGPENAAVGRAIAAVQQRGVVVVAAVGNDGPAAPPAFPASYPGVVAVTAVDGRARVLIEAGRAQHLDYAAPGADILARNRSGNWVRVRGTSYAVPLVAARTAAALDQDRNWRSRLDREAEDLGRKGPDAEYGRGLLCRDCARRR